MPQVLRPDANTDNADWTKYAWDFPPYKSPEFFEAIGDDPQQLEDFKTSPAYRAAVNRGLIHDDEWVLDWCQPGEPEEKDEEPPAPPPRKPRKVHVHLPRTTQSAQPRRDKPAALNLTYTKRRKYEGALGDVVVITWSDGHVDKMQYREGFESNGMGGWHDANMSKALPSASFLATNEQEAIEALHQRRMHPGLK